MEPFSRASKFQVLFAKDVFSGSKKLRINFQHANVIKWVFVTRSRFSFLVISLRACGGIAGIFRAPETSVLRET
jgi:hypothetical protein